MGAVRRATGQLCGLIFLVLAPVSLAFALLSRVRFFTNSSGNMDAEWEDIGLRAKRYEMYPSKTPTSIRRSRTLTPRQLFVRGVRDPMLELETWEAAALVALLALSTAVWVWCCCAPPPRAKLKAT